MKLQILRVCVLLVSISAASVLVWNATRDQKPKQAEEEDKISPKKMQGSSKVRVVIDSDNIKELTQAEADEFIDSPHSQSNVTDEEVKRTRDMMMSTSKSGKIMSDDKIREMLEDRKKEELKLKKEQKLMPSSKSIDAILSRRDVQEIIESSKTENQQEPNLIPSSKNPSRLLDPKEVEKIIERSAFDFVKPQEPEK